MTSKTTVVATAAFAIAASMGVQSMFEGNAAADVRVRVHGSAHVRVGAPRVRVRVRPPRAGAPAPPARPPPVRMRVGGAVYGSASAGTAGRA